MQKISVYKDHEAASRAAAELLRDRVAAHPATEFHLGLSGGSTPRRFFELLAGEPFRSQLSWGDLRFWFADERAVPLGSPLCNFRQAYELLFAPLEIPRKNLLRIPAHRGAEQGAAIYHELLEASFGALPGARGLDLIFLGLGADGHTASLFPGHSALEPMPVHGAPAWAVAVEGLAAPVAPAVDRVSLSLAALNASACVAFLVTGAAKAPVLAKILPAAGESAEPDSPLPAGRFNGPDSPLPAGRVEGPETHWLIDQAAWGR